MITKNKLLLLIIDFILILLMTGSAYTTENRSVFMVLWRGETQAEKGFTEYLSSTGNNIKYTIRDCNKDKTKIPAIISEIKTMKPDLIYAFGTTVTLQLLEKSKEFNDIPIVFNIVSEPLRAGIISMDKSSQRNVTGASHIVPMTAQIKAIRKMINVKKIAFFYNGNEKNSLFQKEDMSKIAENDTFNIVSYDVNSNFIKENIEEFLKLESPDILYIPSDSYLISNAKKLYDIAMKFNVPIYSATEGPIRESGAMFGLVSRYYNVGQLAGYKASQILYENISAKNISVENLKRFSFIINIETSLKVGLIPPLSIMKFAEIVQ